MIPIMQTSSALAVASMATPNHSNLKTNTPIRAFKGQLPGANISKVK